MESIVTILLCTEINVDWADPGGTNKKVYINQESIITKSVVTKFYCIVLS